MLYGYKPDEIFYLFKKYSKKIKYIDFKTVLKLIYGLIFKQKILIDGLNNGEIIENLINKKCLEKNIKKISDVKMPLIIPTVDLHTGKVYCFSSIYKRKAISNEIVYTDNIELGKAVRASCSYPFVFSPCKYDTAILADGGIRENIPWKQIKELGADKVICSIFEKNIKERCCKNVIDIICVSFTLLNSELANYEANGSDYLINIKTKDIGLLDMTKIDELYIFGYNEAKKQIKNFKIK